MEVKEFEQVELRKDSHGNFGLTYTHGDETRAVIINPKSGKYSEENMTKKAYRAMLMTTLELLSKKLKIQENETNRS